MRPGRDRPVRDRLGRVAAVLVLAAATGVVARPDASAAVGAVIAVTPTNVVADGFVGYVFHPQVSGRGEAVSVHDREVSETGFVFLENGDPELMVPGYGAGLSADGCVQVWVRRNDSKNQADGMSIGFTDRCRGPEREVTRTNVFYNNSAEVAVSALGQFAVLQIPPPIGSEFTPSTIVRIDTTTNAVLTMPFPRAASDANAPLGLDISDDGQTVVATYTQVLNPNGAAAIFGPVPYVWDVPSNGVAPLVGIGLWPSLSGNGRFVAFTSSLRLTGTETGIGPWVYVNDRATGAFVRVSAPNGFAYYSSISGDGTQVAFGVGPTGCQATLIDEFATNGACPTSRIDVVFGPTPGLAAGFETETVSTDVNNRATGFHVQPHISSSGRWVTWISTSGNALLGSSDPAFRDRHAFLRERDGALAVDALDFGQVPAANARTALTTVRNTGTTSVFVERIEVSGAGFNPVPGGTCVEGLTLAPRTTCTVNVRFLAPNAAGTSTGSLLVGERGFDPITVTGTLSGQSTVSSTTSTTTTTTTSSTTVPRGPTTTTSTTLPGQILIDPQPRAVDFGPVAVGISSDVRTVTVTNIGNRPAQLTTAKVGANPDDFYVSQNGCNGTTLAVGATCTIDVLMSALAGGPRSATISFEVPGVGGEDVVFTGEGRFSPRLLASPSAITERGLTTIVGQGFPGDQPVTVVIGESGLTFTVQPDAAGMFRIPLAAFPDLTLGSYVVRVDPRPGSYELVQTPLIVKLPTFQPQGPGGPVFGDTILVTRGG